MPARAEDGWILLEALVALAILALALAAVTEAVSSAIAAARTGAERGRALLEAQSLLDEARAGPLAEGQRAGRTGDGRNWTIRIRRHPDNPDGAPGLPVLMEVSVTVQAPGSPIVLTTLGLGR